MNAKNVKSRARVAGLVLVAIAALGLGCASYRGTASAAQPSIVAQEGQWTMVPNFPLVQQANDNDCGAAALAAVLRFWGHAASPQSIEAAIGRTDNGLQAGDMETYARSMGLRSHVFYGTMKDIVHELEQGRPVIVGVGKMFEEKKAISHYEVVIGYEPNKKQLLLLDPGRGWQVDSIDGFAKEWAISNAVTIVAYPDIGTGSGAATTESVPKATVSEPPKVARVPRGAALGTATDEQRYAAREAAAPDAKKFTGGNVIVISATTVAIILLIVIIIILL